MNTERTPRFYIANLGSEVTRLLAAVADEDGARVQGALDRARRIFVALEQLRLRPAERREIEILREVVEDMAQKERRFTVAADALQSYFMPFARKVLNV